MAAQGRATAPTCRLLFACLDPLPRNRGAQDHTEASQWAHVGSAQGDKDCQTLLKEMQLFADGAAFAEGKKRAQAVLSGP